MPGQGFWGVLSRIFLLHDFRYDLPLSSKVNGEGEQPWQSASKGPISPRILSTGAVSTIELCHAGWEERWVERGRSWMTLGRVLLGPGVGCYACPLVP